MSRWAIRTDGETKFLSEEKIRKRLRSDDLTGLELVRREQDTEWIPLHDTEMFRVEVPFEGAPRDAARRRQLQGFTAHSMGFAITAAIITHFAGGFPWWMGIWLIFVVIHGIKVTPSFIGLAKEGKLLRPSANPRRITNVSADNAQADVEDEAAIAMAETDQPSEELMDPGLAREVEQIRSWLERRGGEDKDDWLVAVDAIVTNIRKNMEMEAELRSQVSEQDRLEVERALEATQTQLEEAKLSADRQLLEQRLKALDGRKSSIDKAMQVLRRLGIKRDVAEQQLKQLRLDLVTAVAYDTEGADLFDRLEQIRFEFEALEEVEELIAASSG